MKPILFRNIPGPILIISPHPDDDVLGAGGLIQKAVKTGKPVYILYLTNGDANKDTVRDRLHLPLIPASFRQLGNIRHAEAIKVESFLGVPRNHLFFLSFPDSISLQIATSANPNQVFQSPATKLNRASYPFAFRRNALYTRANAVSMYLEILNRVKPKTIIVNHQADRNPDHRAARILLFQALRRTKSTPLILSFLIHFPNWPSSAGALVPPLKLNTGNVRSLMLTNQEQLKTLRAFQLYRSQFNPHGRLVRLIRQNELFWIG